MSKSSTTAKSPHKTPAKPGTVGNAPVCFEKSEVVGYYPNRTTRRRLAEEWKQFTPEKQLEVRAARSQRGIKCDICGLAGYFRENCPNKCVSPPSTPDSMESTPPSTPDESLDEGESMANETIATEPTGVFWGDSKDASVITGKKSAYQMKQKPDLSALRPLAKERLQELRESDSTSANSFTFFCHSDHTYARSYAELTLQQVMRRMMRLLEKQLLKNADNLEADFDTTLLHPPSDPITKKFYPQEFLEIKEFRDYFYKKESKIKGNLNYKYQGNIRPIDDLDILFRGQSLNSSNNSLSSLYETKANAGESIHAKNTWKSILAKNDTLANSDPIMAKKQEKINQLFKNQSKWIQMQSTSMTYRNDRYEHMVHILKQEIQKEHEREGKLLQASNKRISKNISMDIYQERLTSVDLMIKVLQSYKFTAGLDEADFLLFCLERWEEETRIRLSDEYRKQGIDSDEEDARLTLIYGEENYKSKKKRFRQKGKAGEGTGGAAGGGGDGGDSVAGSVNSSSTRSTQKKGETKDLIAASTHPYYQDQQFLAKMKKKQEKLFLMTKTRAPTDNAGKSMIPLSTDSKQNAFDRRGEQTMESNNDVRIIRSAGDDCDDDVGDTADDEGDERPLQYPNHQELLDFTTVENDNRVDNSIKESVSASRSSHSSRRAKKPHAIVKRRKHPKEIDAEHIAKMKLSFRRAGLGNRIRKGNDDDYAHALPALIPIPKAFDGNSQVSSYTGQNIIFNLKKEMVLSDIGYTRQTAVPLYVRNSLFEKEGTSVNGDPTQEELAADRRYSHYLGRPFVRFNKPKTPPPPRELPAIEEKKDTFGPPPLKTDLTALESFGLPDKTKVAFKTLYKDETGKYVPLEEHNKNTSGHHDGMSLSGTVSIGSGNSMLSSSIGKHSNDASLAATERASRKEHRRERRHAKTVPISRSLVRMAFKPDPTLEDLKYLDDEF